MFPGRERNVLESWLQSSFAQRPTQSGRLQVGKLLTIVCTNASIILLCSCINIVVSFCMAISIYR